MRPMMPPVATPDNKFHEGNPLTGELGTILPAAHLNNEQDAIRDIQSELISILTAAGNEPVPSTLQLLTSLKKLFAEKNDSLGALASLVGAADKLPYFTGSKTAELTALTATGRELIGKANVTAIIAYLDVLKTSNNLSEIKDAGPVAVANTLSNLGLGEVATENIVPVNKGGTGASGRAGAVSGLGLLLQNRWISAAQTMTLGVPITLTHGLPITDPLTCYSDVMIVCSTANSGYSVGDVAIGPQMVDGASSSVNRTISCTPALSATTIQLNVGASGIYIVNKTNGTITPLTTLTGWRVYFRIFY